MPRDPAMRGWIAKQVGGCRTRPPRTHKARPDRPRTINDDQVAEVIERTLRTTPTDATHWSIRSMAAETGFSHTAIRRMWAAFGLQPYRSQTFKLSSDPLSVDKVRDIVGLFTYPRRTEPLSSASMKKARFRHSIASSRSCR
jgi:DNA-binding MurR/RpiR family transcriptional regulator